jgi:hypothetical protein
MAAAPAWTAIVTEALAPSSSPADRRDRRDVAATPAAPLPAPTPSTPAFGGAASGGAAGFALLLLLCLSTFVWAAPPLRRWLRRQPGLRMLPAYVPSFESPG